MGWPPEPGYRRYADGLDTQPVEQPDAVLELPALRPGHLDGHQGSVAEFCQREGIRGGGHGCLDDDVPRPVAQLPGQLPGLLELELIQVRIEDEHAKPGEPVFINKRLAKIVVQGPKRNMKFPTNAQLALCKPFASIDAAECKVKRDLVFDASAKCPAYVIPDEVADAVREKQQQDQSETAKLIAKGTPVARINTGIDGGMNRVFAAKLPDGSTGLSEGGESQGLSLASLSRALSALK